MGTAAAAAETTTETYIRIDAIYIQSLCRCRFHGRIYLAQCVHACDVRVCRLSHLLIKRSF